jgi:NAD(P)-dependent dehydrogenase (short-subunit alcohol dehydrogenase family)
MSYDKPDHILIFGTSGAIGHALTMACSQQFTHASIVALSRKKQNFSPANIQSAVIDYSDETQSAQLISEHMQAKGNYWIIVAIGKLHDKTTQPEKSLKNISLTNMENIFHTNTFIPSLIAKYCLPHLSKSTHNTFAALSARVGSISDNRLGGWYSYRASKAALNMVIKTAAIEMQRFHKHTLVVGLHPGTVDSNLSKPFQKNVKPGKLFDAEFSANALIDVLSKLNTQANGHCFAWDGKTIEP